MSKVDNKNVDNKDIKEFNILNKPIQEMISDNLEETKKALLKPFNKNRIKTLKLLLKYDQEGDISKYNNIIVKLPHEMKYDQKPIKDIKKILGLLRALLAHPYLITKTLLEEVISDSGFFNPDIDNFEDNIKTVRKYFNIIDQIGFNTMAIFRVYEWRYSNTVHILGAKYMIDHQYYPMSYQIVTNNANDIPESKKSCNIYNLDNFPNKQAVEILIMLSVNLIPALRIDGDSDDVKQKKEIKKLVKPSMKCIIDLVKYAINKSQSIEIKKLPEIAYIGSELINQKFDGVEIDNSIFNLSISYLNVFERYKAGILNNDIEHRIKEARNYFQSH